MRSLIVSLSMAHVNEVIRDLKQDTMFMKRLSLNLGKQYQKEYEAARRREKEFAIAQVQMADMDFSEEEGTYGRLYIPDLGISIAVDFWHIDFFSEEAGQEICDQPDKAVAIDSWKAREVLLADHSNQEFASLSSVVPEETFLYLKREGMLSIYICSQKGHGVNTEYEILDWNDKNTLFTNYGGVCAYTCDGNWQNVYVTYWRLVYGEKTSHVGLYE